MFCRSTFRALSPSSAAIWRRWSPGCRRLGLYTNLITSGLGLTESRTESLVAAGLNSAQLSIHGDAAESTDLDAGLLLNMNVVCTG